MGFPKDKIYTLASSDDTQIGNPTNAAGLAHVSKNRENDEKLYRIPWIYQHVLLWNR